MLKKKKPDRRNQAFRFITLEVEIMNNPNLAQVLIKKKPEARLSDFLAQKHSSGIEHVLESSTPNRQKKARELRSGFSIQFRGYTFMNDANLAHQVVRDNTDFLIGDVVVLSDLNLLSVTELLTLQDFDGEFWTTDHSIGRVSEKVIRTATTAELQAKRRLTKAEQALAEVP
jgi:hypothetical protein